jgi:hypothetical protein
MTSLGGGKTRRRGRGAAGPLGAPSTKPLENGAKCSGEKRLKNSAKHSKSTKALFEVRKSG